MTFHPSKITLETLQEVISRYATTVPESLKELDSQRYSSIPAHVAKRRDANDTHLLKEEVVKLVEWKLKHGTFRPKLLQLVQSNPAPAVEATTRKAFETLDPAVPSSISSSVKTLTELSGIGPATASLLLSVCWPDEVPFFSDELFRWVLWDEPGVPGGWKRKIKYSAREYGELVEGVGKLRERLGDVGVGEVEKGAWVLGREGVDVGGDRDGIGAEGGKNNGDPNVENVEGNRAQKAVGKKEKSKIEKVGGQKNVGLGSNRAKETRGAEESKKGVKRKVETLKTHAEGLRRSNRRKTES